MVTVAGEPTAIVEAARLLSTAFGHEVGIVASEALTLERSVWRCQLAGERVGLPESVIVRTTRELGGWRTDPMYLLNDYVASLFLAERCPGVTAQVLVADPDARVVVSEDLGRGQSLTDLLRGASRVSASEGLFAFARTLGRMHAATAGGEDEYYSRRRSFGPIDVLAARNALNERSLPEASEQLVGAAAAGGHPTSRHVEEELHAVLQELGNPGGLLALSNGDPCPYNCLLRDKAARLCDFELAGYRHALLDVSYLYLGFHCCYEPGLIPTSILREAESVYRDEASCGIGELVDQDVYLHGLAVAAAAWAILAVLDLFPGSPARRTGDNKRVTRSVATLESCVAIWRRASQLPALADWTAKLLRQLGRDLPKPVRTTYPALP